MFCVVYNKDSLAFMVPKIETILWDIISEATWSYDMEVVKQ